MTASRLTCGLRACWRCWRRAAVGSGVEMVETSMDMDDPSFVDRTRDDPDAVRDDGVGDLLHADACHRHLMTAPATPVRVGVGPDPSAPLRYHKHSCRSSAAARRRWEGADLPAAALAR